MLAPNFLEKTIFSLFPEEVVKDIQFDAFVRSVKANEVLVKSGNQFDELYIPVSTSILLVANDESEQADTMGSVEIGRSANLFSFLRSLPAAYSFVVEDDGDVLAIPRELVDRLFNIFPEAQIYLLNVTKDPVFRNLAKEFRSIGVADEFIVRFVAKLSEITLSPQSYLIKQNAQFIGPIFFDDGQLLLRSGSIDQNSWLVPIKSWIGWRESIDQLPSKNSIFATTSTNILQIKAVEVLHLRRDFPEDFETLDGWLSRAEHDKAEIVEEEEEFESIEELFEEAIETKVRRWRLPIVRQDNEMDCGPACLSMISKFYGKNVSSLFWRSKLSTDQSGTSLFDLSTTAARFGFISHCLEVTKLEELDSTNLPIIALRKYHYLVVYKIEKKFLLVGDPAIGIRQMSFEDFYDGFDKVGLFLKPNKEFLDLLDSPSPWRHYWQLFQSLEGDLALAFTCGVLGVILSLVPAFVGQIILDDVLIRKNTDLLWILLGVSGGGILLGLFITWAESYYFNFIVSKYNFKATSVFIQKMFSLPYNFFSTRHVGDFTHRLSEMDNLRRFITNTLFNFLLNILTMAIYGSALFFISHKIAYIVGVLIPPMTIVPFLSSKLMTRLYSEVFAKASEQSSQITDLVEGISTIKSSGSEFAARTRFESKLISFIKVQNSFAMTALKVSVSSAGYYQFVNLLIVGLTVYMGINGEISPGKVVALALITNRIFTPLLDITKQWDHFIEMKSVVTRLNDIFLTPSEDKKELKSVQFNKKKVFQGEIEFRDVWFRYGGEASEWVLKGVNFKIESGQKVSIVGPSGSGKSTLAFLITRMYEPNKGQILIDGRDYREYDLQWFRSQIGFLPQESALFSGSIAENIGFNNCEINDEKLLSAATQASGLEFVNRRSAGFSHHIPHGGQGFSVGEKQRISLSRLFYQNPSIAILDESTSALDGISERQVLTSILNEMSSKTILNIAHRQSTVVYSDYAIVLFEGRCIDFGPLSYLRENSFVYQKIFSEEVAIQPLDKLA